MTNRLALPALVFTTYLYAQQDIWIANLLKGIDPLLMTFWNFLVVMVLAFAVALLKRESFMLPKSAWRLMLGLNLATLITWIFTFLALTKASPAVVAAGTLSVPLLLRLVLFEKALRLQRGIWLALAPVVAGLVMGAVDGDPSLQLQTSALIYCVLASFGVVGNSYFMKRLHDHSVGGDSVLFYRFILLVGSVAIYFYGKTGTLPATPLPFEQLIVLALLTSYVPLFLTYYVHRHLEIFTINVILALTPVFSIVLLYMGGGASALTIYQVLSVALILSGVLFGYTRVIKYSAKKSRPVAGPLPIEM